MRAINAIPRKGVAKRMTAGAGVTRKSRADSDDYDRFQAWLEDFDARMAALTERQNALLRSLGVEPKVSQTRVSETA